MKFIISKNTVMLAVITNTISLISFIYLISRRERESWSAVAIMISIVIAGSMNRHIVAKGQGISKNQKIAIWVIYYSTISIALTYSIFLPNL